MPLRLLRPHRGERQTTLARRQASRSRDPCRQLVDREEDGDARSEDVRPATAEVRDDVRVRGGALLLKDGAAVEGRVDRKNGRGGKGDGSE